VEPKNQQSQRLVALKQRTTSTIKT